MSVAGRRDARQPLVALLTNSQRVIPERTVAERLAIAQRRARLAEQPQHAMLQTATLVQAAPQHHHQQEQQEQQQQPPPPPASASSSVPSSVSALSGISSRPHRQAPEYR
jgi:hypothetical protein